MTAEILPFNRIERERDKARHAIALELVTAQEALAKVGREKTRLERRVHMVAAWMNGPRVGVSVAMPWPLSSSDHTELVSGFATVADARHAAAEMRKHWVSAVVMVGGAEIGEDEDCG